MAAAAGVSVPPALAASAPATGSCAPVGQGARGPAVAVLQRVVGASADGDFGPHTREHVLAFQRAHHLPATGVVDQATWAALPPGIAAAACGAPVHGLATPWCPTLAVGSTGPAVAALQRGLRVGVDEGFGPVTAGALRAAQQHLHLPASATTTAATWTALHLTGTPACTTTSTTAAPAPAHAPAPAPAPSPSPTRTPPPSRSPAPADEAAQQAVHQRVLALLAQLPATPVQPDPIAQHALSFALSQQGKPYIWGGTGPRGYDCSGLVQVSYRNAGVSLPRTAADQYGVGQSVPLNQLAPGDIVFYASDVTDPTTIYHDGIYAGDGNIVNAPYTGVDVRVEPLFTSNLMPLATRPSGAVTLPVQEGAVGWVTEQVQANLVTAGYRISIDGGFGPQTAGAVRSFQTAAHLPATGVVDTATWQALVAAVDAVSAPKS